MKMLASLALVAGLLAGTSACDFPEACDGLTASEKDKQAARDGYEVERTDDQDNTCELQEDGSWEVDD